VLPEKFQIPIELLRAQHRRQPVKRSASVNNSDQPGERRKTIDSVTAKIATQSMDILETTIFSDWI